MDDFHFCHFSMGGWFVNGGGEELMHKKAPHDAELSFIVVRGVDRSCNELPALLAESGLFATGVPLSV